MPRSPRLAIDEISRTLESLRVTHNTKTSKIDFRRNPLADFTAAFSAEIFAREVLEQVKQELLAAIEKEMREDPRTAILLEGKEGRTIREKRGGQFREVPRPDFQQSVGAERSVGTSPGAPFLLEILIVSESEVRLAIRLNHPLYIVMHSGARPHGVPPVHGVHVFPTAEAIDKFPRFRNTPYGLANLRSLPWHGKSKEGEEVPFKILVRKPIPPKPISGPRFGRHGNTGFERPNPFLSRAWRRVVGKNPRRFQKAITARITRRIP